MNIDTIVLLAIPGTLIVFKLMLTAFVVVLFAKTLFSTSALQPQKSQVTNLSRNINMSY